MASQISVSSFASNNDAKLIGLPDFDGDGLEDFMVLRNQNKNDAGANERFSIISLYLSSGDSIFADLDSGRSRDHREVSLLG